MYSLVWLKQIFKSKKDAHGKVPCFSKLHVGEVSPGMLPASLTSYL